MKPQFKHEILSTPAAIISGVLLFLVPLFLYGGLYQVLAPLELHRWMEEHLFSNFFRNFITEDVLIRENGRIIAQVGPPVENALLYKVTYAWLFVFFGGYGVGLAIWFWKGFRELMAHSQEMRWAVDLDAGHGRGGDAEGDRLESVENLKGCSKTIDDINNWAGSGLGKIQRQMKNMGVKSLFFSLGSSGSGDRIRGITRAGAKEPAWA